MSARPFTDFEYSLLCQYFAEKNRTRDRLLLVLGCATGFRIRELVSLTVAQAWDGEGVVREITIQRRALKGGRGPRRHAVRNRRVPLSEAARAAIRDHLARVGTDDPSRALFATGRSGGAGMSRSQSFRILVEACEACGIDAARISTHSLRKTFANKVFAASGHDLIRTQRVMGHTSPATTAKYLETDQGELDRLVLASAAA